MNRLLSRPLRQSIKRLRLGQNNVQQRECINFAIGIAGILVASIGVKVMIHNKVREGNVRIYNDLSSIAERLDKLQNKTGKKMFDDKLQQGLVLGYDKTDIGVLGVFTSKAKPTADDSARLKQIVAGLRPQFVSSEKKLKADILELLKEETKLSVSIQSRLNDFCSRSFIQSEDEFLAILKTVQPDIPDSCSALKADVEQLIELMDLRHNVLDPLYDVGTQDLLIGTKVKNSR